MAASVDGRIVTRGWPRRDELTRAYERIHKEYKADAWLCGRITMEPFAKKLRSDTEIAHRHALTEHRDDFLASGHFTSYAIAIDQRGKLAWESNDIDGDHVIAIVSGRVSDEYLAFLRGRAVSYLICGTNEIDFELALDKLASRFSIATIMLEGGGGVNGSMLQAGLVEELSVLLVPVADGRAGMPSLFDAHAAATPVGLTLKSVEQLESGLVWLRYRVA